jgi:error-prone DNA polymerase
VAGIVTHRQRPGTASGVIFATLEDETGTANLVFWPRTFEAYRRVILESRLMVVEGQLQSEQGVINVIVDDVQDRTAWLGTTPTRSRDFH